MSQQDRCHEEDIPAQPDQALADPRVPLAHGHGSGAQGAVAPACEGAQVPGADGSGEVRRRRGGP